jgi:hypothetical protein
MNLHITYRETDTHYTTNNNFSTITARTSMRRGNQYAKRQSLIDNGRQKAIARVYKQAE